MTYAGMTNLCSDVIAVTIPHSSVDVPGNLQNRVWGLRSRRLPGFVSGLQTLSMGAINAIRFPRTMLMGWSF